MTTRWWWRAIDELTTTKASTRSLALVRIFFAPVLWTGYGADFPLWNILNGGHGTPHPEFTVPWMLVAFPLYFVGTTLMFVGFQSRLGCVLTAAALAVIHLVIGRGHGYAHFSHHYNQLTFFTAVALAFSPCGASLSVDRWLAVRRARLVGAPLPAELAAQTARYALCVLSTSIYLFGAIDKMRAGFVDGAEVERLFAYYFLDAEMPHFAAFHPLMQLLALSIVALEVSLGIGL
ncbi:MAG TPA: hypothetical protein VGO62_05210, partial [Myxococcota bacterium]